MASNVDQLLFEAVKKQAAAKRLLSKDHFTLDGTLLEASASLKSFKVKNRPEDESSNDDHNQGIDFHGEKRSDKTHESTTDPDSQLFRKGRNEEARLRYMGHLLTENRNGFMVDAEVTPPGTAREWDADLDMLARQSHRSGQTVGAGKGYDTLEFVEGCRQFRITPHVAAKVSRGSIDGRTTSAAGMMKYKVQVVRRMPFCAQSESIVCCLRFMLFQQAARVNHQQSAKV